MFIHYSLEQIVTPGFFRNFLIALRQLNVELVVSLDNVIGNLHLLSAYSQAHWFLTPYCLRLVLDPPRQDQQISLDLPRIAHLLLYPFFHVLYVASTAFP